MPGDYSREQSTPIRCRHCMELYTKTYYCPDMVSQEDASMIRQTLQNSPGIERIEVDHVTHTVIVTTANQAGMRDVEWLLDDAGFRPVERDETPVEPPRFYAG